MENGWSTGNRWYGQLSPGAVTLLLVVGPAAQVMAGEHKQKVYFPVAPVYAVPTGVVAQAPAAYSYAPVASYAPAVYAPTASYVPVASTAVAAAPMSMAPNNVAYYAPTAPAAAPVGMAPTVMYASTANAPQVVNPGTGFAPAGSALLGNTPPRFGDSRVTDEGRRDVLADLRDTYRDTKSTEKSRTAQRKALKEQAREKYVDIIGDADVTGPDDLKDSENKEIDAIVDMVMREDPSSNSSSPSGYGYPNQCSYVNGLAPQPMYYYYAYPMVPAPRPAHSHHLFHHQ